MTLDSNSKNAGQSSTGQGNLVVVEDREVRWLLLKGEGADAANGAEEESTAGGGRVRLAWERTVSQGRPPALVCSKPEQKLK